MKKQIQGRGNDGPCLNSPDKGEIIGVLTFTLNQDFHFEHLTIPDSGRIVYAGTFIHPVYLNHYGFIGKSFGPMQRKRENILPCKL